LADITIAPYMVRMVVLEHYRGFKLPKTGYIKWRRWKDNVMNHPSIIATL